MTTTITTTNAALGRKRVPVSVLEIKKTNIYQVLIKYSMLSHSNTTENSTQTCLSESKCIGTYECVHVVAIYKMLKLCDPGKFHF